MKRLLVVVLALMSVLVLCSCVSDDGASSDTSSEDVIIENVEPQYFDTLAELNTSVGFTVPDPKDLKNLGTPAYRLLNNLASVIYENDEAVAATFSITKDAEADVTNGYIGETTTKTTGAIIAELHGEEGGYSLAVWQKDGYYCSILLEEPVSVSAFDRYIKSVY